MTGAASGFDRKYWSFGTDCDEPRFLHTMLRVRDFSAALRFYVDGLGMKLLSEPLRLETRRVTALLVGFKSPMSEGCLELVQRWDANESCRHQPGCGHIAVGAPDVEATVARLEAMGAEVTLRPAPIPPDCGPIVAFVRDPDGHDVELIQIRRRRTCAA